MHGYLSAQNWAIARLGKMDDGLVEKLADMTPKELAAFRSEVAARSKPKTKAATNPAPVTSL